MRGLLNCGLRIVDRRLKKETIFQFAIRIRQSAIRPPHPDPFDKLRTGFPHKGGRNPQSMSKQVVAK